MNIEKIIKNLSQYNTKKETKKAILLLRDSRNYYNVISKNSSNYKVLKIAPYLILNKKL